MKVEYTSATFLLGEKMWTLVFIALTANDPLVTKVGTYDI